MKLSALSPGARRRLQWLSALTLAAAATAGCGRSESQPAPGPPPAVPVTAAEVIAREVVQWDEFTGRVEAVKTVELRPRVSGYIQSVQFREGAEVRRGQTLFVIDPRPYQADLDRAEAEQARTASRLDLARGDFARAEKLVQTQAISREEYDTRASAVREAQAAHAAAAAALQSARLNMEWTRVTAPIAGRVSRALVVEGNLVQGGGAGATLLTTLVSLSPMYVYFDADEQTLLRYIRLARAGERASSREVSNPVEVALADEEGFPHKGRIDFVDNRIDPTTGTIRGRAVIEDPSQVLTPGMFARVRIPGSGKFNAVMVSDRAVMTDQSNKFVLVVDAQGKAEYRKVELGPIVEGLRAIREGVKAGEKVIVNGMQRVRPGMQVQAEVVPMPATLGDAPAKAALTQVPKAGAPKPEAPGADQGAKPAAAAPGPAAPKSAEPKT
jgi:RND family efflux transporter MFP subunit